MTPLKLLDLFSGIGGFSLGLERSGLCQTVAFCEIEPFPRKVLAKHWPEVPIYEDVRKLTADTLSRDGIAVDVICGGFPCQDISTAGKGAGLAGERSGLWSEIARLVGELRPRFVIVENVSALLGRGLGDVLGDLSKIGYDAEWHCIPASYVGAPHRRDRIWIIAYPCVHAGPHKQADAQHSDPDSFRSHRAGKHVNGNPESKDEQVRFVGSLGEILANATSERLSKRRRSQRETCGEETSAGLGDQFERCGEDVADPDSKRGRGGPTWCRYAEDAWQSPGYSGDNARAMGHWDAEPDVGGGPDGFPDWLDRNQLTAWASGVWEDGIPRVASGVPDRTHRLKALGNAVVPQIPELIGRAILRSMVTA